jgi:hypothetical protein
MLRHIVQARCYHHTAGHNPLGDTLRLCLHMPYHLWHPSTACWQGVSATVGGISVCTRHVAAFMFVAAPVCVLKLMSPDGRLSACMLL